MPAPAVIPAPIVYFKIVAVKTFVVVPRGAYLGSMTLHCYAGSFLGWSVTVSTCAWGTVALLLSSCRVWTKEGLSLVLAFSEMELSFWNGSMKELLLEWAHDVHLDPSSELFSKSVLDSSRAVRAFGAFGFGWMSSGCECRWFGHWPNCEQIKVFKTGNVFLVRR